MPDTDLPPRRRRRGASALAAAGRAVACTVVCAALLAACGSRVPLTTPAQAPRRAGPDCPAIAPARLAQLRAIADEINEARTRPRQYAAVLAQVYATMGADGIYRRGELRIRTDEGRKAVDEAVAFLRAAAPQPALTLDACTSWAAQDHADELGRTGGLGHVGRDGSQPSERATRRLGATAYCGENLDFGSETPRQHIASLIVDDGVPARGHRHNLFRPEYRTVGIGIGPHPGYGFVTAQLLCR